jgi:taurine dioxygenase
MIQAHPISGAIGAEISGVDLSEHISDETITEIRQALLNHQVIFFRDQDITPDQQRAFGARFGLLDIHPFIEPLDGYPEILVVKKEPEDTYNLGNTWHADATFYEEPPLGSLLFAREVPPFGGDTMFTNLYLAYEALSPGMRALLDGLNGVHSPGKVFGKDGRATTRDSGGTTSMKLGRSGDGATAIHPIVRTHPETGRKALFITNGYLRSFEGMTDDESRPLIDYLLAHVIKPEFTCRFTWSKGAMAFWDNRCSLHYPINDYHGYRRVMHRVTVKGDRPR